MMIYGILAALSAAGLLASIAYHVLGLLQIEPPGGEAVFLLHVSIFVVWFPLVVFANRTMPKHGRGNLNHLLAELPRWARVGVYVLFGYAAINFAWGTYAMRQYPKHGVPLALTVRCFSGHWMLFHGTATAGFVGLSRLARKRRDGASAA